MTTTNGQFEQDVLAALRLPSFYTRWGKGLPKQVLSPMGQQLAAATLWCHQHRTSPDPVGLEEIKLALARDPRPASAELLALAEQACLTEGPTLEIQAALATDLFNKAALQRVMQQATTQHLEGKVNLDALLETLRTYRASGDGVRVFDPAAIAADFAAALTLPTPWTGINRQFEGGIRCRELGMVMATPKAGKTRSLINLSTEGLARGWTVLYVTAADLGYAGIASRHAACWLDRATSEVRANVELLAKAKAQWESDQYGGRLYISDYTNRPCGMPDIERDIDMVATDPKTKKLAVFIDRLEEAIPTERSGDLRRDIKANYAYARILAGRYACPVWVDSQAALNEGDEGWVDLTRGAESRVGKAAVVDLFVGIGVHPENDNILRVTLAGRREIRERRHELQVNPGSGQMYE